MRPTDSSFLDKVLTNIQTPQNKNSPEMEVICVRAFTGITRKEYWQESIITEDEAATVTSVAVRRTGKNPDRVFAAYVTASGNLVVKSSKITYPTSKMAWTVEAEIEGCMSCAVEFDGSFIRQKRDIEYWTETEPWLIYTTVAGALYAGILGGPYELLAASGVTQVDIVRGIRSIHGDIDQGLLVFYIVAGGVFYRQFIAGNWEAQQTVSLAPDDAVAVKAERLFDYRIVLHVEDISGSIWEVFSNMEASGWISQDHISVSLTTLSRMVNIRYLTANDPDERITVSLITACRIRYAISPVMVYAENINNGEDDFGYKIRVTFDERVYDPDTEFILTDSATGSWGCTSAIKISDWIMELEFLNFNNAQGICKLSYTSGSLMGEVVPVEAGFVYFTPVNLIPFEVDPPVVVSIENIEDWSGGV